MMIQQNEIPIKSELYLRLMPQSKRMSYFDKIGTTYFDERKKKCIIGKRT